MPAAAPPADRPAPRVLRGALLASAAACALASACATGPVGSVPAPPAEVDAWTRGEARHAFLGLKTEENDSRSLSALTFEPGVRVVRVVENSPAERAGLAVGDVVLAIDGRALDDPPELDALVDDLGAGAEAELTVRRGDATFAVRVVLVAGDGGGEPPARLLWHADPSRTRAGWAEGARGPRLVSVAEGSPLAGAGLRPGDELIALDGEPVRTPRALLRRLAARAPGETVVARVVAAGRERDVEFDLYEAPRRVTGVHVPILFTYEASADGDHVLVCLLDFWVFEIFRYERTGPERTWTLLHVFDFSTGVGELGS